jgi:hypothetical protein
MEEKLGNLEKRTKQLEKREKAMYAEIKGLQSEVDLILKKNKQDNFNISGEKVNHLTEINEEMFRQNVRLRELIEYCIAENEVPTQKKYYEALLEAKENS